MKTWKDYLNEMPVHEPEELPRKPLGYLDDDEVSKYNLLYKLYDPDYYVLQHKTRNIILVTRIEEGQDRHKIYVSYSFHNTTQGLKFPVPLANSKSTKYVVASSDVAKTGAAKELYFSMAEKFPVVSDNIQYDGGYKLWKYLAKNAHKRGIVVKVWDGTSGKWIVDDKGSDVYNGTNIPYDKIWSKNYTKLATVLVAYKK